MRRKETAVIPIPRRMEITAVLRFLSRRSKLHFLAVLVPVRFNICDNGARREPGPNIQYRTKRRAEARLFIIAHALRMFMNSSPVMVSFS